jgi:hypothetical protein
MGSFRIIAEITFSWWSFYDISYAFVGSTVDSDGAQLIFFAT